MKRSRFYLYTILFFLLVGAFYFRDNAEDVYANIGKFYFKHNKVMEAQKFYEKSFLLGNTNSTEREMYVNSIITSPLTLEAQEKLVKFVNGNIEDQAYYRAKEFLNNLKQEISLNYPDNYIKQAPYNQQIVRWSKFPITYSFKNYEYVPVYYIEEIRKAFTDWEKNGNLMFTEIAGDANIIINFKYNKLFTSKDMGTKYVVAYTVPSVTSQSLDKMNITFNLKSLEGKFFTKNQIYNTALHEIFHAVGFMGHSFNPENIMYFSKDNNTLLNDYRAELTKADIMTQKLLYKIKPDITNLGSLKSEYIPYLLLGDIDEISSEKALEAKKYIYHAPKLPSGYIDLAESYVAQKRYAMAIRCLERAYQLADTSEMRYIIYYNLSVCYFYINHIEMALEYIDKALELKNNLDIHFLKAEILLKKDKQKAIEEFEYLISKAPDKPEYSLRLANIYIKDKAYLKARHILKSFVKNNPQCRKDSRFKHYKILLF